MALPTFEEMRRNAHRELADVLDGMRSDWQPGAGPTARQAEDWAEARSFITKARAALDRAAR
jgi:hypothetical protein